ncbi:MAG: AAA family ATPase [Polyangiaceae bacterium]|nr:AAA family ATPase [Polyangiaceae bacterium]
MAALHASTAPILTVVAGPGLGKTTLLDRLVAASGRRALRSRCYANESIRWNAIDGLLDSLLAGGLRVDPDDDADLAALARLFPALSRRAAPPLADGAPLAERLRSAARGLLRLVERDGIGALIVDDVQWADADSMALLRELLALPSDLSVIIAMRGPDARSDAISEGLARSGRALERLELAPLDAEAISELWSALRPFEPVDLEHVLSATGGVPS